MIVVVVIRSGFPTSPIRKEQTVDFDAPNKSPEPTAVDALSSAVAVHGASRRWLSLIR